VTQNTAGLAVHFIILIHLIFHRNAVEFAPYFEPQFRLEGTKRIFSVEVLGMLSRYVSLLLLLTFGYDCELLGEVSVELLAIGRAVNGLTGGVDEGEMYLRMGTFQLMHGRRRCVQHGSRERLGHADIV
jgi:hypothetical protein